MSKQENIIFRERFVAVAERMDESLVVMKLLFDLDDGDIVVLSSKKSGGIRRWCRYKERCVKAQKAFTTLEINEFIRTNFTEDNYDYLLYAGVDNYQSGSSLTSVQPTGISERVASS
jgi:hypothetical protein